MCQQTTRTDVSDEDAHVDRPEAGRTSYCLRVEAMKKLVRVKGVEV